MSCLFMKGFVYTTTRLSARRMGKGGNGVSLPWRQDNCENLWTNLIPCFPGNLFMWFLSRFRASSP